MTTLRRRLLVIASLIFLTVISYLYFDSYYRPRISIIPLVPTTPHDNNTSFHPPTHENSSYAESESKSPNVLLVSALFPLPKSKHSASDYDYWLVLYLSHIRTPVYFFAPPSMEERVRAARGDLPIIINTTFSSPFDIPPLSDMELNYEEMHQLDREKGRHSPGLYAIWNAKPYFLDEGLKNANAMLNGSTTYDFAFWNDAGSFRSTHKYENWPDPARVQDTWARMAEETGTKQEELMFFPIYDLPHSSMQHWTEYMGPIDNEFSEGSFYGGPASSISWFAKVFYAYHNQYLSSHVFVGKDQTLINSLFVLFPARFLTLWMADPLAPNSSLSMHPHSPARIIPGHHSGLLGNCGAEWFYYQFFFASEDERDGMREVWLQQSNGWVWEQGWGNWWKGLWATKDSCRSTKALSMSELLKRAFGASWRAPGRSLHVEGAD